MLACLNHSQGPAPCINRGWGRRRGGGGGVWTKNDHLITLIRMTHGSGVGLGWVGLKPLLVADRPRSALPSLRYSTGSSVLGCRVTRPAGQLTAPRPRGGGRRQETPLCVSGSQASPSDPPTRRQPRRCVALYVPPGTDPPPMCQQTVGARQTRAYALWSLDYTGNFHMGLDPLYPRVTHGPSAAEIPNSLHHSSSARSHGAEYRPWRRAREHTMFGPLRRRKLVSSAKKVSFCADVGTIGIGTDAMRQRGPFRGPDDCREKNREPASKTTDEDHPLADPNTSPVLSVPGYTSEKQTHRVLRSG